MKKVEYHTVNEVPIRKCSDCQTEPGVCAHNETDKIFCVKCVMKRYYKELEEKLEKYRSETTLEQRVKNLENLFSDKLV